MRQPKTEKVRSAHNFCFLFRGEMLIWVWWKFINPRGLIMAKCLFIVRWTASAVRIGSSSLDAQLETHLK